MIGARNGAAMVVAFLVSGSLGLGHTGRAWAPRTRSAC